MKFILIILLTLIITLALADKKGFHHKKVPKSETPKEVIKEETKTPQQLSADYYLGRKHRRNLAGHKHSNRPKNKS